MKRRIFLGFRISNDLTRIIVDWQKQKKFPDFVRFIEPENLHMTLIPPWYESEIDKVAFLLSNFLNEQKFFPFEVEFTRIASAPRLKTPRILWLKGKKIVQLESFRDALAEKLRLEKEKRKFIPHITVARFKRGKTIPNFKEPMFYREKLNNLVIFESKLSRRGAFYRVLESFKL